MAYDFNMNDLTDRQRAAVAMDGQDGLRGLLYGGGRRGGGYLPSMFDGGNVQSVSGATDKGLWDLAENERLNYIRNNGTTNFTKMFADADKRLVSREQAAQMAQQAAKGIGVGSALRFPNTAPARPTTYTPKSPNTFQGSSAQIGKNLFDNSLTATYADGRSVVDGRHTFGMVQGPGGPKQDSVGPAALPASGEEAYLSNGEAVLPAKTVNSLNNQFFGGDDNGVEKYTLVTNQPFKKENQSDLRRRIDEVGGPNAVNEFQQNYMPHGGNDMKNKSKLRKYADGLSWGDSFFDWGTKKLGGKGYPQEYLDQLKASEAARADQEAATATRAAAGNYNEEKLKAEQEKAKDLDPTNIGGVLAGRARRIDELSGYSDGKKLAPKKKRLGVSALRKMAV